MAMPELGLRALLPRLQIFRGLPHQLRLRLRPLKRFADFSSEANALGMRIAPVPSLRKCGRLTCLRGAALDPFGLRFGNGQHDLGLHAAYLT